ncbi:MAG: hypothetical protein L6Q35_04885 [Phycisphaerales bacterium]|nr:hypothetical protein [Phycisphaerales bacterium]
MAFGCGKARSGGGLRAAAMLAALFAATAGGCKTTAPAAAQAAEQDQRVREARDLLVQADQARKAGKKDEAIDLYRRSLGLDGSSAAGWHNLGTLLMEKKDYMGAASALRSAADLDARDPRPLENLGLTYFRAGYDDEALTNYMESLRRDPNHLPSIRGVAMCSYRLNRANEEILDVVRRGVLIERDAQWRTMLQREKIRIEQQIKAEKEDARREGR